MLLLRNALKHNFSGKRTFYEALNALWNRVSRSRVKEVGPDRACAEWLMRNGAFLRWKGQTKFVEHYDNLPLDEKDKSQYFIEEIKAEEAAITHHGFGHFQGCQFITKISLNNCMYINDNCLKQLDLLTNSLSHLEVIRCSEVTDKGLISLRNLKKLEDLKLGSLQGIQDIDKCLTELRSSLPKCNISILKTLKNEE